MDNKNDDTLENTCDNLNENCKCDDLENDTNQHKNIDTEELLRQKELELQSFEDKYKRAYADFENTKKRLEREKYQALEYANEGILKDFLPILDTLESALNGIKDIPDSKEAVQKIADGIQLTIDNFTKALQKHNVEVIDTGGEFDPNVHNAIMHVKDEGKQDGHISQVIQKGYKYKDRLIRPSMVSITKNN